MTLLVRGDVRAKILPAHLERAAYVYVRQSSLQQVEHHRESARRQYELVAWAHAIGWPEAAVQLVDDDQGKSSSTPQTRAGFGRLIAAVGRGEVGVVIGLEASRLARNSPDWANLVYLCRWTDTLIADETGIYDPKLATDRMTLGLRGQVSELELDTSIQRMHAARWHKAERGELVGIPPAGYDRDDRGQLVITPDEAVVTALRTVFEKFQELGSAMQVALFMHDHGLKFPVRRKELQPHVIVWLEPTRDRVLRVLHHPVYAGAYVYGRYETVRALDGSAPPRLRLRRRKRDSCPVLIPEHHAGYITMAQFRRNQEQLVSNQSHGGIGEATRGAAREGRALLQGLARCGRCGRRMYVAYGGRRPGRFQGTLYYQCSGRRMQHGGQACQVVFGRRVDEVVVEAFLAGTAPAGAAAALAAAEQLRRGDAEVQRWWRLRVEKAEYEAQRAQRQYDAVEPENRVVARELERRWNSQLEELEQVRQQTALSLAAHQPLSELEVAQVQRLGADLESVWQAPSTTDRDRKQLLRCVIEEVQLRAEPQRYTVRIVWKGGEITDREVRRLPKWAERRTPEEMVTLVRRLAGEFDDAQIARILNKQGRRGASGRPFTRESVRCIRREHEIPKCAGPLARDPREGPFTADEAAAELGVAMTTIHRWLRDGVLAGTQATVGAPWRIVLTEAVRRRLTGGECPAGWVGLSEAATRLGLSKSHVAYLIKTGKLQAVRGRVGKRQCWRIDVSSAACGRQQELFDQVSNAGSEEA